MSPSHEPVRRFVDTVLRDLSVRTAMYVGRRSQDEDAETFVIQTGEDGRRRLSWPDLDSDRSMEAVVADAQAYVGQAIGAPVPRCPLHEHALIATVREGALLWLCSEAGWGCPLGEYEELTWPQLDIDSLAPILSRRLERRGISGVVTVGVRRTEQGLVADFGLPDLSSELTQVLREVAAPLTVSVHKESRRPLRPLSE